MPIYKIFYSVETNRQREKIKKAESGSGAFSIDAHMYALEQKSDNLYLDYESQSEWTKKKSVIMTSKSK